MNLNNIINRIKQINPNIKFVGEFNDNNKKTGYWEQYYENGDIWSKGNYLNGLKNGYWEKYWFNGLLKSKGNYLNDQRTGYWELYYQYGNISSKGNFINSKWHEIK